LVLQAQKVQKLTANEPELGRQHDDASTPAQVAWQARMQTRKVVVVLWVEGKEGCCTMLIPTAITWSCKQQASDVEQQAAMMQTPE
jgi:hypothetical protein